jgi:hypothetical protein
MLLQRANGLRREARHRFHQCIYQHKPSVYPGQRQLNIARGLRKKPDPPVQDEPPPEKTERLKLPARKTSLRRVGLEAERSRVIVRHRGGLRVIDPEVQTKVFAAYYKSEIALISMYRK